MRYWAWFTGKLTVAAVVFRLLLGVISKLFPPESDVLAPLDKGISFLLCDLALMLWFLLAAGALYLVIWDQRYRCRVCLRRLRMPIETGSWSSILQLGRPRIEYICPYGHGTLREDELQISGLENAEWTPHSDDIWAELCETGKEAGDRK
ncbi:MAG TPA: hypothetical protein VMH28_00440 [Candidatus Acidoferrales bacterium]|nr:hypothetical protein [Candidatus Acidoferrales bacterium]